MKYAIFAYVAWGFFPVYWKFSSDLPAMEILCHRIIWTLVFYTGFLAYNRERVLGAFRQPPRIWLRMAITSALLSANWFLYIWAVNAGQVIETSLGYFINPLVNVALGVLILKERLTRARWVALFLAVVGVIWLSCQSSGPPWIALTLAFTFGLYGFMRKTTPVDSARGGQMESFLMIVPATIIALSSHSNFHGLPYSGWDTVLLVGSGLITGLPLIWFADAARLIPLNLLGFVQYISPTLQFLLGVLVYSEPFDSTKLVGYSCIWAALLIFAYDMWAAGKYCKAEGS